MIKWSREKSDSPFGNNYISNTKYWIKNNSIITRKNAFELHRGNTFIKAFSKLKDAKAYAEKLEG